MTTAGDSDETPLAAPQGGLLFVQAIHQVLERASSSSRADLLLAAACQVMSNGSPMTAGDIREQISTVWPGSPVSAAEFDRAMELGQELNLVTPTPALGGSDAWVLTANGLADVQRYGSWVADARERALDGLIAKATAGNQEAPDRATAELWLGKLISALVSGIRTSQSAYLGDVESLVTGHLRPRVLDRVTVLEGLADVPDPAIREFLEAAALAALDPLDPFGNELVSHITTGCILHAFVAGRDRQTVLERIGSPRGVRVILDTPVLLQLVGPRRLREPLWEAVRLACDAGWDVVVCKHSLEELGELLERDVPAVAAQVRKAIESGTKSELYASLVDEQLPSIFVESLADGTHHSESLAQAHVGLDEDLAEAGVVVREHHNDGDEHHVRRCFDALDALVGDSRSAVVIERDANTMAMIWRRRRRGGPPETKRWPAGWVVTFDRRMRWAYKNANRDQDRVPLTLSPSQWMTLVSVSTEAISTGELAGMAATQLIDEAMWQLPMRFSPEVALELASALSPTKGASDTDVRVAQLSLDTVLDDQREPRSGISIAAEVLESRAKRIDSLHSAAIERAQSATQEAKRAAREATLDAADARAREARADGQLIGLRDRAGKAESERDWARMQFRRALIAGALGLVAIAAGSVVIGQTEGWFAKVAVTSGALVYLAFSYRWCTRKDASLWGLVFGGVIEGVGLLSSASDLYDRLAK